jgi:peptidoglycan/xylan/chitin deacetylase (PgdA/CDA1 family)
VETIGLAWPARFANGLGTTARRQAAVPLVGARFGVALRRGAVAATGSWSALSDEFGRRLPVLAYHRVGPRVEGANPDLTITPGRFRRQIGMLRRLGYTPITSARWLAWCETARPLPARPVLITFDDAYADLAMHAFPALVDGRLHATLFVPSARLGGANSWDERLRTGTHRVTHRLFDARSVRSWNNRGIEVGAHGRTHARLTELAPEQLATELLGSRSELEQLLDHPVSTFAYPFGAVNERVRDATSTMFDAAFTIEEGVNTLGTDPLLLRRTSVAPTDTVVDLLFRLWLGWSPLHRLRLRVVRRLTR